MAPDSSSFTDAHNGFASPTPRSATREIRYPHLMVHQSISPSQQPSHGASTYYNHTGSTYTQSRYASTNTAPSDYGLAAEDQVPVGHPAHHANGIYYHPTVANGSQETLSYETHVSLDEDYMDDQALNHWCQQQHPVYGSNYHGSYSRSQQYDNTPRTPPQEGHGNLHYDDPPSPQTQSWSTAFSSEERIRLGLPSYETEEQRRFEYERAAAAYESRRTG